MPHLRNLAELLTLSCSQQLGTEYANEQRVQKVFAYFPPFRPFEYRRCLDRVAYSTPHCQFDPGDSLTQFCWISVILTDLGDFVIKCDFYLMTTTLCQIFAEDNMFVKSTDAFRSALIDLSGSMKLSLDSLKWANCFSCIFLNNKHQPQPQSRHWHRFAPPQTWCLHLHLLRGWISVWTCNT